MLFHPAVYGVGEFYEIWGEERCYYRHRHDYRIQRFVDHTERRAESGDDKRELSNLHQRETRLDGNAQRLSGDKHASCAEHNHADNHYCREDEDWHGVGGQHLWVDHHAYRHEEDCSEQILYRGHYS